MTTELITIDLDDMNELISKLPYSELKHLCWKAKSPGLLAFVAQTDLNYNIDIEILNNPNTPSSARTLIEQKLVKEHYYYRSRIAELTEDKCLLIELLQDSAVTVQRAAQKRLKELLSLV